MNVGQKQLVVVVLLTGGRPAIGPTAAGIAGDIYRRLTQDRYFARREQTVSPASLISTQICCTQ
jgi:hypothetical protein